MSDTDVERTHCIMCDHKVASHEIDENGLRPCRSVGHPKGMPCTECWAMTTQEYVAAVMARREASYDNPDGPDASAWAAYRLTLDHVRHQIGPGWQAFFTDVHQAAVMSALIAYDKAREQTPPATCQRCGEPGAVADSLCAACYVDVHGQHPGGQS